MSTQLAETRLIANTLAYKQSLRNIEPIIPPDSATSTGLPNDAARSSKGQRTRQRRFGDSRHSSTSPQNNQPAK